MCPPSRPRGTCTACLSFPPAPAHAWSSWCCWYGPYPGSSLRTHRRANRSTVPRPALLPAPPLPSAEPVPPRRRCPWPRGGARELCARRRSPRRESRLQPSNDLHPPRGGRGRRRGPGRLLLLGRGRPSENKGQTWSLGSHSSQRGCDPFSLKPAVS